MGIFRQFPYSNFHDMNMDEVIKIVKQMLEEWVEYQEKYEDLYTNINEAFNAFTADFNAFIENLRANYNDFIDSIDIEAEFRGAINSLINDGTFTRIVSPVVVDTTTEWLNTHITQPTTPVIDSSLTVSGAAADSKAAGDYLRELRDNLISYNDFNVVKDQPVPNSTTHNGVTFTWSNNHVVTMTGTASPAAFSNIYFNTGALPNGLYGGQSLDVRWNDANSYLNIIWYKNTALLKQENIQGYREIVIPEDANGCVIRVYVASGSSVNNVVNPVILTKGFNFNFKYVGVVGQNGYSLLTLPNNSIAIAEGSEADVPLANYSGYVFTFGNIVRGQMYIVHTNGRMYYRRATPSGMNWSYSDWIDMPMEWAFQSGSIRMITGAYTGDLNDATPNSVIINTGDATNAPTDGAGYCMTLGSRDNTATRIQLYYRYSDGATYYRRSLNMTWSDWNASSTGNTNSSLLSVGNSILSGSVWTESTQGDYIASYGDAPYSVIADSIGVPKEKVTHELHSSTGMLYDAGTGNFLNIIKSKSLVNVDAVLTHFWIQDMNNYPLGTLDSQANDGSLVGAVLELIRYIKSQNKAGQLIVCSVPPCSTIIKGDTVFTGVYGNGKSIAELDTMMAQLAAREKFIYINWQDLTFAKNWQELTWNGNNVHLSNAKYYRMLGAYAGGRASSHIHF